VAAAVWEGEVCHEGWAQAAHLGPARGRARLQRIRRLHKLEGEPDVLRQTLRTVMMPVSTTLVAPPPFCSRIVGSQVDDAEVFRRRRGRLVAKAVPRPRATAASMSGGVHGRRCLPSGRASTSCTSENLRSRGGESRGEGGGGGGRRERAPQAVSPSRTSISRSKRE